MFARRRRLRPAMLIALLILGSATTAWAETVEFPSTDIGATALSGYFVKPEGRGPFGAAIMLHGCSGAYDKRGRTRGIYRNYIEHLTASGFAVLLVDSFRPRGYDEVCQAAGAPVTVFYHRPNDAIGAARFLAARSDIDAARIALLGWSHGAISALGASMAPFDMAAKKYFRAVAVYYPACEALAARNYAPAVPTLIMVGLADNWTPAEPCIDLARRVVGTGANLKLVAYLGAYHGFDAPLPRALEFRVPDRQNPGTYKFIRMEANEAARQQAVAELDGFLAQHLKAK